MIFLASALVRVISAWRHRSARVRRASGRHTTTHLSPAHGAAALSVLDEQVGSPDLTRLARLRGHRTRVVLGHVNLQLLRVRAWGWLPAGRLLGEIEVVGEILAVAVAHLPAGGQARLLLRRSAEMHGRRGRP